MSAVRGVLRDLVERKLWPIAVLLLAAAVAVPIYLGRASAEETPLPATNLQADAGKVSKAAIKVDGAATGRRRAPRRRAQPLQAAARAQGARGPGATRRPRPRPPTSRPGRARAAPTAPQPPLAPGGTGGTGGSGDGGSTPKPPAGDPLDVYHLSLRFGRAEATQLKTYHDVARLSPLPTADNPFFVYTGVLKDGKTAVFLLSSDATATGDGHCRPSAKSCQTIEVKEGDTEFFDLTVNGEAVQYQLDVVQGVQEGRQHRGRRRGRLRAPLQRRRRHAAQGPPGRQLRLQGRGDLPLAARQRRARPHAQAEQGARLGQRRRRRLARRRHGRPARPAGLGLAAAGA